MMRRALAVVLLCLLAVPLAPTTQGALNGSKPFESTFGFLPVGSEAANATMTIASGAATLQSVPADQPFALLNATQWSLTGLTKVCWATPTPDCLEDGTGGLSLSMATGTSVGLKFPYQAGGTLRADHALAFFLDLDQAFHFRGFEVKPGKAVAASTVGGSFTFNPLQPMPTTATQDLAQANAAGLVLLSGPQLVLNAPGGGTSLAGAHGPFTFSHANDALTFQGRPATAPIAAQGFLVPFAKGSTLDVVPAASDAAKAGLDTKNVQALFSSLDGSGSKTSDSLQTPDFGVLGNLTGPFNGLLVHFPVGKTTSQQFVQAFDFARATQFTATSLGAQVKAQGDSPLHIEDGHIQGAAHLVGVWYLKFPWWSYLLWGLALTVWIVRLVLKAPKKNEKWDSKKWIGWVASLLALVLVAWLWDGETKAILGASALSVSGPLVARGVLALIEFSTLSVVLFAVASPIRMMLRNGFMLGRQGTFMGLAGAASILLGYVIGAHLYGAYLDELVANVLKAMADK